MAYNIEEEAKRFIESKKVQFRKGLTQASDNMADYILDNLWCNSSIDKHGIQ